MSSSTIVTRSIRTNGFRSIYKPGGLVLLAFLAFCVNGCGQPTSSDKVAKAAKNETSEKETTKRKRICTRVFWQDRADGSMRAGDLTNQGETFELSKLSVGDFPGLDTEKNDLVQMVMVGGHLFVGVRDHEDGSENSGWIKIDPGVEEESHGDHSHWHYDAEPSVAVATLDAEQGNPAHVYHYGRCVYLANDKKNGFTMIDPKKESGAAKFYQGGGGHITLAAVGDRIAYSTWIDRSGENAGRVDVVDLRSDSTGPRYSFALPSGGIHGATACGNRVFFAPADGVCWVDCDFDFVLDAESVKVQHLSLGDSGEDSPYRTGAFASFQDHVLCIAKNKTGAPALCIIDGTSPSPSVTRVECELEEGLKLSTVKATSVAGGNRYAFAFAEGEGMQEKLLVFDLDPDGDRKFSDAKQLASIDVGKSELEGHFGHHGMSFLEDRKTALISNPGDGTINVLSLVDLTILETIDVGGKPTHIVCYGASP